MGGRHSAYVKQELRFARGYQVHLRVPQHAVVFGDLAVRDERRRRRCPLPNHCLYCPYAHCLAVIYALPLAALHRPRHAGLALAHIEQRRTSVLSYKARKLGIISHNHQRLGLLICFLFQSDKKSRCGLLADGRQLPLNGQVR
jgi:hypothetical protein